MLHLGIAVWCAVMWRLNTLKSLLKEKVEEGDSEAWDEASILDGVITWVMEGKEEGSREARIQGPDVPQ
ncbi:hypothetical protein E2C01_029677 [Portunus trituberculatus]|uniref:Uncharacterized protein n=1 Tax=Portunus trituberculatus TaxID=210409 RepID=A0A5B7ESK5_PORTR|nr:hypothetical protein [Portunus trituberculatus]